jgi:hypothetical protein
MAAPVVSKKQIDKADKTPKDKIVVKKSGKQVETSTLEPNVSGTGNLEVPSIGQSKGEESKE